MLLALYGSVSTAPNICQILTVPCPPQDYTSGNTCISRKGFLEISFNNVYLQEGATSWSKTSICISFTSPCPLPFPFLLIPTPSLLLYLFLTSVLWMSLLNPIIVLLNMFNHRSAASIPCRQAVLEIYA